MSMQHLGLRCTLFMACDLEPHANEQAKAQHTAVASDTLETRLRELEDIRTEALRIAGERGVELDDVFQTYTSVTRAEDAARLLGMSHAEYDHFSERLQATLQALEREHPEVMEQARERYDQHWLEQHLGSFAVDDHALGDEVARRRACKNFALGMCTIGVAMTMLNPATALLGYLVGGTVCACSFCDGLC